jgi:hypothetical protein
MSLKELLRIIVWSLGDAKRRLAWLAVFLVGVSLTEDGLAGVARRVNPASSREQVFRVGRLAPTREG